MAWNYEGCECKICGERYKDIPNKCKCGNSSFLKIYTKPTTGEIKVN